MYLRKAYVDEPGGRRGHIREMDGILVPTRDFGFVSTMRAGLLAEIADTLAGRRDVNDRVLPAEAPAPIGILCSFVDCRSYGLVRLTDGKYPSLETLAGYVPAEDTVFKGAVQALRLPVRQDEHWYDDTSLCGFDLRRIRDRLLEQKTSSCLSAWPKNWVPGYGPKEGFQDTLCRGCLVRLAALVRIFGEVAGPWRRLEFSPVELAADLMAEPPRLQSFSAMRLDRDDETEESLRFFTGRRGMETWVSAEAVSLVMLFDLVRWMDDIYATKGSHIFVLP